MSADDNRSFDNLVLLCIEHSYEVDERPEKFPAERLREWKRVQLEEYASAQHAWPVSDADAREIVEASEGPAAVQHADAVVAAVKAATRLALVARRSRDSVAATAEALAEAYARARAAHSMWDENGKRLYAEPSSRERYSLESALSDALKAAQAAVAAVDDELKIELAAARATKPTIEPWCRATEAAADSVLNALGRWPNVPPEMRDDEVLEGALRDLREAADALAAVWRGEPLEPPRPLDPPAAVDPTPDPLQQHQELLERARPFRRVQHLPYDASLRRELVAAAKAAVDLPPVLTTATCDLSATAWLAAAVAGNAGAEEISRLVDMDQESQPLCVAALLLDELSGLAEQLGLTEVAEKAHSALIERWSATDWASHGEWSANKVQGEVLFRVMSRRTSAAQVMARLGAALASDPALLPHVVAACAPWQESRDANDMQRLLAYGRNYRALPPWFPVEQVLEAASVTLPHVSAARYPGDSTEDPEQLLSQVLRLAGQPPT